MTPDEIESQIIKLLNKADEKLDKSQFNGLAESTIDYIDEISRSKNR